MAEAANTNSRAELLHFGREMLLPASLLMGAVLLCMAFTASVLVTAFVGTLFAAMSPIAIVAGSSSGSVTSRVLRNLPLDWVRLARFAWWSAVVVFPAVGLLDSSLENDEIGRTLVLIGSVSLVGSCALIFQGAGTNANHLLALVYFGPLWMLLFGIGTVLVPASINNSALPSWTSILPVLALIAGYISWHRLPLMFDPAAFKLQDRQEKPVIFQRAFESAAAPVALQERLPLPVFFIVTLFLQALVGVLQMLLVFAMFYPAVASVGALVAPFIFLLGGVFMTGTVLETWIERLRVLRHLPLSPSAGAGLILGGGILALLVYTAIILLVRALVWPSISWEQVLFMVLLMLCLELAWVTGRLAFWNSRAASEMVIRIVVVCAMLLSLLGLPSLVQFGTWVVFGLLLGLGVGLWVVLRRLGVLQPLRG